jgi:hypothetical protein
MNFKLNTNQKCKIGIKYLYHLLPKIGGSPVFTQIFQVKTQIFQVVPQKIFFKQNDQNEISIKFLLF